MRKTTVEGGRLPRLAAVGVVVGVAAALSGCVTVAEHRKLEARVDNLQAGSGADATDRRVADLAAEVGELRAHIGRLQGRLEIAEKRAGDALSDAEAARRQLAALATAGTAAAAASEVEDEDVTAGAAASTEVSAYRTAYGSWRSNDDQACIDGFRKFLQAYPASDYADDAGFWMADCHYRQGDHKNAVLRFDDVVRNYPSGNKAPDALYRQGESLLKLGPGFHEAAKRAFERVVKEYPDSARASEARSQLELIGAAG